MDLWYQNFRKDKGLISLQEFGQELYRRFGELAEDDMVEKFNNLQQIAIVIAYQERFEKLRARVMYRVLLYIQLLEWVKRRDQVSRKDPQAIYLADYL